MIKHFFASIYRNILRDKIFTLINLTNLTIGFTTFILLGMVVSYEFNYDKSNKNYDRIYRVQTKQEDSYPTNFCTFSPAAFRYHLLADLPEVEQVLLMREVSAGQGSGQFFTLPDGSQLYEKYGYWSENSIFDIFTINLKEGTSKNALTEPNTIVLSETLRQKLFPNGGAVCKQVAIGKRHPLTVTAVYNDFPLNSNMRPSYLVSMSTFETLAARKGFRDDWTYIDNDNYILLKKGADHKLVDVKIKDAFKNVKNYEKSSPYLHPLSKHHISPNSQSDMLIGLSILSLAGMLVLILSCVNYVNLSLANSTRRACEIGIKKVVGFSKKAIAAQFITETLVLTFLAMIIGLFAAQLATPLMAQILQKNFEYKVFENGQLLLIVLLVSLLAGLLSGLYPALVLSAYNPVTILKGKLFAGTGKSINLKKVFGWNDPIGKQVFLYGKPYPVIGVVKDFHPFSVHNLIPTYVMFLAQNELSGSKLLTVRFTSGSGQKARQLVTSELETIIPNDPFEFKDFKVIFFMDGAISFWQAMKRLFLFFAVVTLVVSSIGLFGLILFTTKRRTKEIGIRKVLGSSVGAIYGQLSTEVIGLLGFATLVACPAAWYIYKTMPGAYKEPLTISEFLVAIGLIAVVAFITISYHVLKVALSNPVEALRYE